MNLIVGKTSVGRKRRKGMICCKRRIIAVGVFAVLWATLVNAQNSISAAEAKSHVGEKTTVCGEVASAHYAQRSRGNPTFINLDKPYPNQVFTILIWGSDRTKFDNPEQTYSGKRVCVTGKIDDYKGTAEIVVHDPSQIKTP
jgi:DNA/RNA endonuclease YhcR with UshA esterase domain